MANIAELEIDERPIISDWFADSAATSHVTNRRDAFIIYDALCGTTVAGVGNITTRAEGRGTVKLLSRCNNEDYILRLMDVLHVPGNQCNLISLGRWERDGRHYIGRNGTLSLIAQDGKHVAQGTKIANNLYRMNVTVRRRQQHTDTTQEPVSDVEQAQTWETWHKRFGHVGYSGLQTLFDHNLVDGLSVDVTSPKPDCIACTEAQQSTEPFNVVHRRLTTPGELTHIDLWGKCDVTSINGYQYHILLVDDRARYITIGFLEAKDQATQHVQNYLNLLKTHGKSPRAIRVDRGKEFVNETLQNWCGERGIDIQITAPYSPSPNGVAMRMNRILVELARAMLSSSKLPKFLWEPAVAHAAYLRNLSYTKAVPNFTPYQIWRNERPNVSHLREFGAPVWISLQGQKISRKMLPKSQRRAYVGFDDGLQAVRYYNTETRKIFLSRNFRPLFPARPSSSPQKEIEIPHDPPREEERQEEEGELPINTRQVDSSSTSLTAETTREGRKRKRTESEQVEKEPRRTQGIRRDYGRSLLRRRRGIERSLSYD